jgi:Fe-S-cluster containining protein
VQFDYPATVRFRCKKCGICCGNTKEKTRHVLLLKNEVEQIAKTTLQPITQFATKIKDAEPYSYEMKKRAEDGKCIFLENNLCTIYSIRPLICRFYPFELTWRSEKYNFHFTNECIGIGKGTILHKDFFKKLLSLAVTRHREVEHPSRKR